MRMIMELAGAIRKSILLSRDDDDPDAAAQLLEASLDGATEMDGSLLLTLEPETMATMLQLSGTDPMLIGYVTRTLLLESKFLEKAQSHSMAAFRREQAFAVAESFGIELDDVSVQEHNLEQFFADNQIR